jgi:class 3 adenylate cyclase
MSVLMVVDDEEGVRRSLKRVLEKDGYEVILAQNGEEALSILRSVTNVDIVISDYRMPGIDGIETLVAIGRSNPDIARIMLTGYATMASAIKAVNEGIDGFLTKPFENEELKAKVREYTLKKRLKQFVSEQVMTELQRDGKALSPRRLAVSVIFTDIRGFTSLSEKIDPTELSSLLNNHYFNPIDNIIFKHTGMVDKHIGDSVMGVFGAPVNGDEDSLKAVSAAIEIRETMALINQELGESGHRLDVGIGIATGEAMAGIIGSMRKKEYTVLGDAVNLASRLEKMAGAGEILICENTEQMLPDTISSEILPSAVVRGLSVSPRIYRVLSRK